MTQLDPEIRAMMRTARGALEPSADQLARGRARLATAIVTVGVAASASASVASAATTGAATTTTASVATVGASAAVVGGTAIKISAAVVAVVAAIGGGKVVIERASTSTSSPLIAHAPRPMSMPPPDRLSGPIVTPIASQSVMTLPLTIATPTIATPVRPENHAAHRPQRSHASIAASEPIVPTAVIAPEPPAPALAIPVAPSPLSIELSLLDRARRAIRISDFKTARALVTEHRSRFPGGQLAAERERIARAIPDSSPSVERKSP